eukprot:1161474-Pelagomonas_calceolata.AAC.16
MLYPGLPVPRPPPLLPLLAGLPHLHSLGLAGVWASQCVREASAATAPGAPASSVSLEVALAGLRCASCSWGPCKLCPLGGRSCRLEVRWTLWRASGSNGDIETKREVNHLEAVRQWTVSSLGPKVPRTHPFTVHGRLKLEQGGCCARKTHAQVYHCVAYDQLCRLLHPVLQLPHLHSLGLHFCGTAPKGASATQAQGAGQQGNVRLPGFCLVFLWWLGCNLEVHAMEAPGRRFQRRGWAAQGRPQILGDATLRCMQWKHQEGSFRGGGGLPR